MSVYRISPVPWIFVTFTNSVMNFYAVGEYRRGDEINTFVIPSESRSELPVRASLNFVKLLFPECHESEAS